MSSTSYKKVSPCRVRKVDERDRSRIYCQLKKAAERMPNQELQRVADPAYATDTIVCGAVDAVVLDEAFLVVYGVGKPWYYDTTFLEEQLVLRIGPGSNFKSICDLLDDLKTEHGAEEIIVGGALCARSRALIKLYKANGYVELDSPCLIKRR